MSSNRLIYDTCEYQTRLNESTNTLNYTLDLCVMKIAINVEWN